MNHDQNYCFSHVSLPSSSPASSASFYPNCLRPPISLPEARYTFPELCQPTNDLPVPLYKSPPDTYSFATSTESLPSPIPEVKLHVPRPPNAFMLFRSNMLKTKAIPQTAEKRQQQLSKVAGECWNLLSPAEKQVWHDEAAKQLREHQVKYPDYKFTPASRGSSRKMKRDADQLATSDKDRVRELREKWTQIYGPAAAPSRRRKPKQKVHNMPRSEPDLESQSLFSNPALAFPTSPTPSRTSSPSSSVRDGSLPPVFPNPSYPHYSEKQPYNFNGFFMNDHPVPRPPSTSSNSSCDGSVISSVDALTYPTISSPRSDNGLCAGFNDLDITPTVASFRESDMHTQPPNALRQPPSFTSLISERTLSEPPFLSPLIPSPSELVTNFPEQIYAGGAFTDPNSTGFVPPFSYDPPRLDELNFGSLGPIPSVNGDFMDFGSWNFTGDGGFRL
ncbi:hypothetical protein J3R30DRAFT_3696281 [Lentinula aciculospora]|uniref:HMG box domain-containing protein n=1 Tax=Lentinula aciculospora TaxID=153920 RepID=A0A9W9ASN0_9AGAR|nr:hypothetical protein J3R30DRAFT_3400285 [Lentinula aciculospora]KAJ4488506.1 hypothetical protein J3R30DRAFT_3696281 [Lentinula aciculospora]